MIKSIYFILIGLGIISVSIAQEGTASPYSFYGIGSLKLKGTAENRSMGGLSIYTDSIHVNLRNPASYGGSNLKIWNNESRPVKFTVGGLSSSTNLKTTSVSDRVNTTSFDYLALAIPINKLGFGFGLVPFTSVGYRLESNNENDLIANRYRGEGGVNRVFLGVGYQINKDFSVGFEANYNFGNIQNTSIAFLYDDDDNLLQYQSRQINRSNLSGINFNFGLTYTPQITEKLQLHSALRYIPKSDLTSENTRNFATIVINAFTGQEFPINEIEEDLVPLGLNKTDLVLPETYAFGVGIGQPRKWFVGAEYSFLKTSQFSNIIFTIDNVIFKDASSISVGGFFIPRYNSFGNYFKRVVYRAGFRYEDKGLEINNETINEFGISFGVGLPVGRRFSNANIGIEIGQRGTTAQNLVQENFVNFQLSLSLNDRWFQKRKYN